MSDSDWSDYEAEEPVFPFADFDYFPKKTFRDKLGEFHTELIKKAENTLEWIDKYRKALDEEQAESKKHHRILYAQIHLGLRPKKKPSYRRKSWSN